MALATIEDFAAYLRHDLDEFDTYIAQLLVDSASELVTTYCGWHIAPSQVDTLVADGSGGIIQALPTMYLTDLVDVTEDGNAVDAAAVEWSENGVLAKASGGTWTGRRRGIAATVEHGFAATPKWLVTLVCAVAGRAFNTPLGVAVEGAGGESIQYATPYLVPPGAVALMDIEKQMLGRVALPNGS